LTFLSSSSSSKTGVEQYLFAAEVAVGLGFLVV
jgi:hypothetical protein